MTRAARDFAIYVVLPFLFVLCALVLVAHGDAGDGPIVVTVPPAWYRDPVVLTSGTVIAVYGLIALLQSLGRERWRWTRWLRVGRVQGHLAGLAGMLSMVTDAAMSGTLRPGAAIVGMASWALARSMPGSGEARPVKGEDAPP